MKVLCPLCKGVKVTIVKDFTCSLCNDKKEVEDYIAEAYYIDLELAEMRYELSELRLCTKK